MDDVISQQPCNLSPVRCRPARGRPWLAAWLLACLLPLSALAAPSPPQPREDTVVAVFPAHFPPIFSVTANGLPGGYGIELMEAVAARAGVRVQYRSVPDWPAALAALQRGEADLIPNLGITAARRRLADFSRPLQRLPLQLFVRRGKAAPASLDDFRGTGRIIAVVRRNAAVPLLDAAGGIHTRRYDHLADALFDLLDGQVAGLVYPGPTVQELAARMGVAGRIRPVGEPLLVVARAIAVAKGHQALLSRLDEALGKILDTPEYQRIYARWHPPPPPFWNARRITYLVIGLLALAMLVAVVYRLRLLNRSNARLAHAKAFTETVLDAALEGIVTLDARGLLRSVNSSTERIFQRTADELLGAHVSLLLPRGEAEELLRRLAALASRSTAGQGQANEPLSEYQALRRGGELFPVRMGVVPVQTGQEMLFVCTVEDLSRQREAERQANYYADHDALTGLLNQRGAMLVLDNLLAQAARYRRQLVCVNIGIDRLSHVNDIHGRQAGDTVLTAVAERLRDTLRDSDVLGYSDNTLLARAGGDRFLVLLPETGTDGGIQAAKRILDAVAQRPFAMSVGQLHIYCRAGVATFPEHGDNAQRLLSHAESALHLAKQQAMTPIRVFTADDQAEERLVEQWAERIRVGLREDRFELHFQPIQHIASGDIHHYECLVRYRADDGELLLPGEFIPIAERLGLIGELDIRVLELAITHLAALEASGRDLSLSVNISGAHIGDNALFSWLERLLEEHAVDPAHIIIEITETAAMENMLRARSFTESLRALGCRIALDDFGVGFSSFSHLRNLPVDIVKIDGSFVKTLPDNPADQVLVRALTDIAHSLGKEVIAEYVCSPQILTLIRGYGVDYAQGFHIGRPRPMDRQPG